MIEHVTFYGARELDTHVTSLMGLQMIRPVKCFTTGGACQVTDVFVAFHVTTKRTVDWKSGCAALESALEFLFTCKALSRELLER